MDGDTSSDTMLRADDTALVATGSWLKNLLPDRETYAEGMSPLALGGAMVKVRSDGKEFMTRVTI
jgi:hypothetical protein